jgi:hypothetical protein
VEEPGLPVIHRETIHSQHYAAGFSNVKKQRGKVSNGTTGGIRLACSGTALFRDELCILFGPLAPS